ncbi:TonB-dependent receptor domain-containing protein [Ursidibacter arcticus]
MKLTLTPITRSIYLFIYLSTPYLAIAKDSTILIDEINVSGQVGDQKSDQAFTKAGGIAIRGEEKQLQSLDSVVRALPGTYTNIDPVQGTLTVNIRGMAGLGRVNTVVDGVPQTFFGTSANGDSRFHDEDGGLPPSSQHGTMIDPNFLTEVSINKGFSTGAQGVNALAGSASFKTIDVDDVIFKGNKVGVLSKFSYGTNALGYNGMLALAGKTNAFSSTGSIGGLFAYSQHKIGSNYKRGDGKYAKENTYAKRMEQRPASWLAKIELLPTDQHRILLSARDYRSNIGGRDIQNKNYSINYHYTPTSDVIDFELLASKTTNTQKYDKNARLWVLTDASTSNKSDYIDLKNTSNFNFWNSELVTTLGTSYFNNHYARRAKTELDNLASTPFSPEGKQRIISAYLNNQWKKSIYTLESGLTYTYSNFRGFKPACGMVSGNILKNGEDDVSIELPIPCFPQGDYHVNTTHHSINPSLMLSANISDWFSPFISYSKSTRMPNIQEVFFNNEGGGSMNPFLRPEKAQTYQIGFNTFKHNWLTDTDKLGIKLLYYRSKIKNFISSDMFYIGINQESGFLTNDINAISSNGVEGAGGVYGFQAQIATNSPTPVKTSGVELELNYDTEKYFGRLTYSYEKTSQPIGIQSSNDGFGFGDIYELPKHYATLDIGTRFLDKKLTLGGIIKYTNKSKRINPKGVESGTNEKLSSQKIPQNPMIADIYAIYKINKNFTLKASIQNVFNSLYIDPINRHNSTSTQYDVNENDEDVYMFNNYARGRTYLISGEVRF